MHAKSLPPEKLKEAIADAYFVGIRSATGLTAEIFEAAPRLIGVGRFCIGTNQIDLDCARERGVPVFNAPFSNTRSVAELVIAEAILLMRGIPHAHRAARIAAAGSRPRQARTRPAARRSGSSATGTSARRSGVLAEALGMRVLYYDIETKLALGNARPERVAGRAAGARTS